MTNAVFFFVKNNFFCLSTSGHISSFLPSFCAAACHCCAGLVCTLYTGGLCAFACLSPCSHCNLLPDSLPFPFSARPIVAMPPHHTVIVWSLMATMIRVCRLQGGCLYAGCKLMLSHPVKWLLTLNEQKTYCWKEIKQKARFLQIYNVDTQLRRFVVLYLCLERPIFKTGLSWRQGFFKYTLTFL